LIDFRPMSGQDEEADYVPAFSEFSDPRLVAVYDTLNPIVEYETFYVDLAAGLSASSIIDIGCGTGLLTCELAKRGHRLVGVEPSSAMLDVARHRCGEQVEWIEGDALGLGEVGADLAIMTGHVAQIIRDDEVWSTTLMAIREALGQGGRLAFESRNPLAQEWTAWTPQASRRRVEDAVVGPVEVWFEDPQVDGDLVRYEIHYLFGRSGEELVSHTELRFCTREELSRSLREAGFWVESIFGNWDGRQADSSSRELIFVAVVF